jgi:PadR family transcriptional regulator PadR
MFTQEATNCLELREGTRNVLILRTLIFGRRHGQGIAIRQTSEEELLVERGALYPALRRLAERGWIFAKWGTSANNRKARSYSLTCAGRKQLVRGTTKRGQLAAASGRILGSQAEGS